MFIADLIVLLLGEIPSHLEEDSYFLMEMDSDGTKMKLITNATIQDTAPSSTLGNGTKI
jgi:hypothetical protein